MRRPLRFRLDTDLGPGVCVVDLLLRTINDKPSPAEMSGKTKGPVDALLEHNLDGGWMLIVVRGVLLRENLGHEVDDGVHA